MIVVVGDKTYDVGRQYYRNMLRVAKESTKVKPYGVYAIEKDGHAIFLNRKAPNKTVLKKQIESYESKGFRVFCNG